MEKDMEARRSLTSSEVAPPTLISAGLPAVKALIDRIYAESALLPFDEEFEAAPMMDAESAAMQGEEQFAAGQPQPAKPNPKEEKIVEFSIRVTEEMNKLFRTGDEHEETFKSMLADDKLTHQDRIIQYKDYLLRKGINEGSAQFNEYLVFAELYVEINKHKEKFKSILANVEITNKEKIDQYKTYLIEKGIKEGSPQFVDYLKFAEFYIEINNYIVFRCQQRLEVVLEVLATKTREELGTVGFLTLAREYAHINYDFTNLYGLFINDAAALDNLFPVFCEIVNAIADTKNQDYLLSVLPNTALLNAMFSWSKYEDARADFGLFQRGITVFLFDNLIKMYGEMDESEFDKLKEPFKMCISEVTKEDEASRDDCLSPSVVYGECVQSEIKVALLLNFLQPILAELEASFPDAPEMKLLYKLLGLSGNLSDGRSIVEFLTTGESFIVAELTSLLRRLVKKDSSSFMFKSVIDWVVNEIDRRTDARAFNVEKEYAACISDAALKERLRVIAISTEPALSADTIQDFFTFLEKSMHKSAMAITNADRLNVLGVMMGQLAPEEQLSLSSNIMRYSGMYPGLKEHFSLLMSAHISSSGLEVLTRVRDIELHQKVMPLYKKIQELCEIPSAGVTARHHDEVYGRIARLIAGKISEVPLVSEIREILRELKSNAGRKADIKGIVREIIALKNQLGIDDVDTQAEPPRERKRDRILAFLGRKTPVSSSSSVSGSASASGGSARDDRSSRSSSPGAGSIGAGGSSGSTSPGTGAGAGSSSSK
jgi:uncharacterized membrane protein YgcG